MNEIKILNDSNENQFYLLLQKIKSDNSEIIGDELAYEINNEGWRSRNSKLFNKGTIGHELKRMKKITDSAIENEIINPSLKVFKNTIAIDSDDNHIEILTEHKKMIESIKEKSNLTMINPEPAKFELDENFDLNNSIQYTQQEALPAKQNKMDTLNDLDFNSTVELITQLAINISTHWKICTEFRDQIREIIKCRINDKEKLQIASVNSIYWDKKCQDIDEPWMHNKLFSFKSLEAMKNIIIPKKINCIGSNCKKEVIIRDKKDINLSFCDYHLKIYKYNTYINSVEWKELCRRILARDKYLCRGCGETKSLEVHHITYDRLFHELEEDLTTLCRSCHEVITQSIKARKDFNKPNFIEDSKKKVS